MTRCWRWSALALGLWLLATGCSGKTETKTAQVSGTVKIDGNALPDGEISFVGDAGTVPDVLPIKDGAFSGAVKPGKKKVEIRVYETKKAPASATGGVTDSKENVLPERFNTKSTLSAEVTDSGITPNHFDVQKQ